MASISSGTVTRDSPEYRSFLSSVPKKKVIVDSSGNKEWTIYDAGPKTIKSPLIFLPPVSGTADVFFKQILTLSSLGFRVISVDSPAFWSVRDWCIGFRRLLDHLQLDLVHIFGSSLGGFLAQKFAEMTNKNPRVKSLLLCNTFNDTSIFGYTNTAATFWMMPSVVLKKMVISGFDKRAVDSDIADAIDFMVDKLETLSQEVLASRLTLNCVNNYVEPQRIHNQNIPVTIVDVFDEAALSTTVAEEMEKCFPEARYAHLKSGGNFPFLSRADEVNVLIRIHLQQFCDTRYAPFLPTSPAHVVAPSTSPAAHSSSAPLPVTPPDTPDASTYLKKNRCDTSGNWAPVSPSETLVSQSNTSTRDLEEWDSMMKELETCGDPFSPDTSKTSSDGITIKNDLDSAREPFVSPSRTDAFSVRVDDGNCNFTATPSSLGSAYEPTNELLQR